ncbi:unnamed protein product (macronuclear) [Paramecium tetraurelia]|uniref:Uncharacterized protein n=1 Tax=Paramecium tetraurelia TaxID=5888 RepID=A0DNP3_PARTE|nr:uncharacterized protein GSPATT00018856001 [Paramecium tetraurelia]CAK84660.1 unnamed protein product [Paramecium tetraurelia]|eukprot:XP_001452057.1 hypothetical protein (macronuclear) [Paramecium tetraurelia strain d4-2]
MDDINKEQEIQNTNQIEFYALQDPLNSQISNQQNLQFQQYISDLKNDNIQNDLNKFEKEQIVNQTNNNFLETIKIVEDTQIIQNELLSSQRTQKNNDHQIDEQDLIKYEQDDKEQKVNNKKEDINEEKEQNQEEIIQMQSGDGDVQQQGKTNNLQEDQQILVVMEKQEIKSDTEVVTNKNEEFEQMENKVDKPTEVKEEEEEQQQIVISQYGNEQNSNVQSHKIEKEPSIQSFQKKDNDQNLLQLPSQMEFHLLKSCESNFFEPPNSGKETVKYLNSGELLSRTNFLSQLGQLGKFEFENNSLLGSGDLKKDIEGLPEPLNLRNKSNNQQELFSESQTFPNRMPSDFRSPFIDDTFKLSTTFKFQFSSELKAFESGQFISQQFNIKVQQQDSLEYSMDESSDLQPIYITTMKVDDNDVDVFQIKNVLRFKDKNNLYQCYDFKISKMQQLNSDYIIQNLFVFIMKNRINCIDGNQIVRIQRYLKRFRFVQSCVLTLDKESTLICLFKSFFQIKMCFYRQVEIGEQIIIEKMTTKQRRILELNFYSICPQLLFHDKGLEQKVLATIDALGAQS